MRPRGRRRPIRTRAKESEKGRAPTLIVFAREPVAGRTKTRLVPAIGARDATALARAFILDTLAKARRAAPRRLVVAGDAAGGANRSRSLRALARRFGAELIDQGRGTLGVRMARALAPYAGDGAVLIGTDTPSLPPRLLRRSLTLLRRYPVVLGPSLDGGYYLIGVRGPMADVFRGIRWGSAGVLAATLARLKRDRTRYRLGPAWYDVDRPADLALLAVHLARLARRKRANPCPETVRELKRLGLLRHGD